METTIWQAYQNEGVIMLGIINTSDQIPINNFVEENSITFPVLFDSGSPGGVQGGDTYDDYYLPNDGSPYPRDFIVGILQYPLYIYYKISGIRRAVIGHVVVIIGITTLHASRASWIK